MKTFHSYFYINIHFENCQYESKQNICISKIFRVISFVRGDNMKIGDNIKRIRKEKGLKQKELAEKLNMPVSTLANYENNKREPNLDTIHLIASALDTLEVFLLKSDNSMLEYGTQILQEFNSDDELVKEIGDNITILIEHISNTIGLWDTKNNLYNIAIINVLSNLEKLLDMPPRIQKNIDIKELINSLNEISSFIDYHTKKIYKDEC